MFSSYFGYNHCDTVQMLFFTLVKLPFWELDCLAEAILKIFKHVKDLNWFLWQSGFFH